LAYYTVSELIDEDYCITWSPPDAVKTGTTLKLSTNNQLVDFQTLPYVQDGKDGDIAATGFLVKKSSTDDTIVAGLKGNQDSDALLWGGGTVGDADHAANNNYVTSRGDKIPTLLKKDGTGKIGVMEIDSNNIVLTNP
jgi:hypothetical protein